MRHVIVLLAAMAGAPLLAANEPVIDMHMHFYSDASYGQPPPASRSPQGLTAPANAAEHEAATLRKANANNIVLAVASSPLEWSNPDRKRLLKGLEVWSPDGLDLEAIEQGMRSGEIRILGEFGNVYTGSSVLDPRFKPLFALAEKYDVPLAWHAGEGPPLTRDPPQPFRLELSNPLLLQEVLMQHPRLRVYVMHAGGVIWRDEMLAMMHQYRNLYVDIGVLTWVDPYVTSQLQDFLLTARRMGFLDRVMFGSDQMQWPDAIDRAVRTIEEASYLTQPEKRDILYNNAARFLRLDKQ